MRGIGHTARNGDPLSGASDELLVEMCTGGSESAFNAIVERYRRPLVSYCARIVGASDAEDVVQQTFARASAALRDDRRPEQLKPWLYRVAHNSAIDTIRKSGPEHENLETASAVTPAIASNYEARDRMRAAVEVIKQLPDRQRKAVVLHEFEGRSYDEISEQLATSPAMVSKLLQKARAKVRAAVGLLTPLPLLRWMQPGRGSSIQRIGEIGGGGGSAGLLAKVIIVVAAAGVTGAGAAAGQQTDGDSVERAALPAHSVQTGKEVGGSADGIDRLGRTYGFAYGAPAAGHEGEDQLDGGPDQAGHQLLAAHQAAHPVQRDHLVLRRPPALSGLALTGKPQADTTHGTSATGDNGEPPAGPAQPLTRAERKQQWLAERKQNILERTARMRTQHEERAARRAKQREESEPLRQAERVRRQRASEQRAAARQQALSERQSAREQANQQRAQSRERANQQRAQTREESIQRRAQARQESTQKRAEARQQANQQRQQARQLANQQRAQARQQANQKRAEARQQAQAQQQAQSAHP